jgi:hypothetical protein
MAQGKISVDAERDKQYSFDLSNFPNGTYIISFDN